MVNELSTHRQELSRGGLTILKIYMELVPFYQNPPSLHSLHSQYCVEVDRLIINLQAQLYPDDFYDGSPSKRPTSMLPDSLQGSISEAIGIPENVSIEEIAYVLDMLRLTYTDMNTMFNTPLKGVW